MSSKKKPTPKTAPGRVIDFNALLGNYPTIQIGDQSVEGRAVNQTEKMRWLEAETTDDVQAQRDWLVTALNARGATVDAEWVNQWPDAFLVALVKGLHGLGWPGDEAGAEGK